MFISPFWCGVGATILAEIALLVIAVICTPTKKK